MGAIISFVLQGLLSLYTFFAWQCSQGGYRFGPVLVRDCIRRLEHVPKYLLDFFDQIMLQFFGAERFIFDDISPSAGMHSGRRAAGAGIWREQMQTPDAPGTMDS